MQRPYKFRRQTVSQEEEKRQYKETLKVQKTISREIKEPLTVLYKRQTVSQSWNF
jgi:hypothetical protein